ncbi:MAG: hypothetical protein KKG06_04265 [Bacteroidetes bacterium]|nr:hypothetical protein [Bacteroidota bacterium]MBU1422387.1 hypothetical protein [Bacteroidota bacterium]
MEKKIPGIQMIVDTLRHLFESKIVVKIEILEDKEGSNFKMMKLHAELIDSSNLYITEIQTTSENKYSYHWQAKSGKLVMRWDNAPHWKKLKYFPHHTHYADGKIESSNLVTISDILDFIGRKIKKGKG